jgi:hypothetical protein
VILVYANPPDDPRERLNYSNGQRLAASDFRAEQGHHTGMRRVLNRSLYSSGIVAGLEVEVPKPRPPEPADKHSVIVKRGLAFDHLGREIFLPVDIAVQVMGAPSTTEGLVFGNLLVISYREQRKSRVSDGCVVATPAASCRGAVAWGAPTRIAADAVFEVLDSWPADESGKVVIAQLELNAQCEVVHALPGVRQYAMPVKAQKVRGISLEGEKDIDKENPKVLFFHIDGGYPESATLYLRARKFSSLYYTELGAHVHTHTLIQPGDGAPQLNLEHSHELDAIKTGNAVQEPLAKVQLLADVIADQTFFNAIMVNDEDPLKVQAGVDLRTRSSSPPPRHLLDITNLEYHTHPFPPGQETKKALKADQRLGIVLTIDPAGVSSPVARTSPAPALGFVDDLKIFLDGQSITEQIRQQLEAKPGQAGKWTTLGNGQATHALAQPDGTREIDLLKVAVELGIGPHKLELRVDKPNMGGNIQYNLYVS